jgi:hypothetical protein
MSEDIEALCAKLEKVDHFEDRMSCYRNPDGPEAAALIRSLSLRVEAEKRAREEAAAIAKDLADRGYSGDAIAAALRSRT